MNTYPNGTRVTYKPFGYIGILIRYERVRGVDYAVVQWRGRPFTERYYPNQIEAIES